MRTRGQVDGVRTYAETLYQTVPSTAEGVEAFRAASAARGGSMTWRTSGPGVDDAADRLFRARPAVPRGAGPAPSGRRSVLSNDAAALGRRAVLKRCSMTLKES